MKTVLRVILGLVVVWAVLVFGLGIIGTVLGLVFGLFGAVVGTAGAFAGMLLKLVFHPIVIIGLIIYLIYSARKYSRH